MQTIAQTLRTGSIVVVQDADLEYDLREIPDLIGPIKEGVADVCLGSRFMVRRAGRVLYFRHFLANKLLTFFNNFCTDLNLTDVETGCQEYDYRIKRVRIRGGFLTVCTLDDLAWHRSPIQLNVRKKSAVEVIEQIRALPDEERAKVVRFVIEHEESWIPAEFREAMNEAAQGKMVNMERVMAGEKPPGA